MSSFTTKNHNFSPDYGQNPVEWLSYLTKEEIDTASDVKKSYKTLPIITYFKKLKESNLWRRTLLSIFSVRAFKMYIR